MMKKILPIIGFCSLLIIFVSATVAENSSSITQSTISEDPKAESNNNTVQDPIENDIHSEPNVLQEIRLPIGGPYLYPEILKPKKDDDVTTRRKIRLKFSPQLLPESEEQMEPVYSNGIIENVWPYERKQSEKEKETRKYVRLSIPLDKFDEAYRFIGKAAERAFISRYYEFINPSESKTVDDLIRFIEDTEKTKNKLALQTEPDPLLEFNSFSKSKKLKFCKKYINKSIILSEQNVNFDPSHPEKIVREQKNVQYKYSYLQPYHDTVDVVKCPCIDTSDNTRLELGVSPVHYKYKQKYRYAFIYDILKDSQEEDPDTHSIGNVTLRALTKIQKSSKRNEDEIETQEIKNAADDDSDSEEGVIGHVVHKLFAPIENLHFGHREDDDHSHHNFLHFNEKKENDELPAEHDKKKDGFGHRIFHKIFHHNNEK